MTEQTAQTGQNGDDLAIVLGGGGARAAYQAGFLRGMARYLPESLEADRSDIRGLFLVRGLAMIVPGVALGLFGGAAAGRLFSGLRQE